MLRVKMGVLTKIFRSEIKESACNVGDLRSIPGLGSSPGEGNGNPLQYSCLENPMDGGAWQATVHRVAKSRTRLSDVTSLHFFPGGTSGKEKKNPPANTGDIGEEGLIPGSGRSPRGENGNPLQYSCLEDPMDKGAWQAAVHRVTQSRTQLK